MNANRSVFVSLLATVLLLAAGCDTSFDAFEDTDRTYSVFGYLDGNADQQRVRVEPLRDSISAGSDAAPLDARVTTENVETGETVVWEQQVERVGPDDSLVVHNFTTEADLQPGATYRFRVEREGDGATASAEVTPPPPFPESETIGSPPVVPRRCDQEPARPTLLQFDGIERLGAVRVDYDYQAVICAPAPVNLRLQTTAYPLGSARREGDSSWVVRIPWTDHIPENPAFRLIDIYSYEVTVAAASEDWPTYAEDNPPGGGPQGQPLPPPGIGTNIEGGVGFLGGTFTRTVDIPVRRN